MADPAEHTMTVGGTLPNQNLADTAATKVVDDGLKKRMRIFVEASVKMVSPVFLAACVSLSKVDLRDQPGVRDSWLSTLAGCTLASGVVGLLPLSFPKWFPHKHIMFVLSMVCIYLCGILLMVLAYLTVLLISMEYIPLGVFFVYAPLAIYLFFIVVGNGHAPSAATVHGKCLDESENSVDLLAAITFLLFLSLGGLMLGGQCTTILLRKGSLTEEEEDNKRLLAFTCISLSFIGCITGVLFMLRVVPHDGDDEIRNQIDVYNYFMGCILALIVLLITLGKLGIGPVAIIVALSILPFMVWGYLTYHYGAIGVGDQDVKPASLDLVKVTFTGFLSISVYTISENSPVNFGESSCWFIFFTAIAVNNGIGWRIITHQKKPSAAWFTAGNVASLAAHTCIIAASIPFAIMASDALRKNICTTAPSPAPCP